jgi:predicted Ser/Thr protein kinase
LTVESIDDLVTILKRTGYSRKAVNEILKWYTDSGSRQKS